MSNEEAFEIGLKLAEMGYIGKHYKGCEWLEKETVVETKWDPYRTETIVRYDSLIPAFPWLPGSLGEIPENSTDRYVLDVRGVRTRAVLLEMMSLKLKTMLWAYWERDGLRRSRRFIVETSAGKVLESVEITDSALLLADRLRESDLVAGLMLPLAQKVEALTC